MVPDESSANEIEKDIKNSEYEVDKIKIEEKIRKPAPPFITSTLQQDASRTLKFSPAQTMNIAQQLYQGLKLGTEGENHYKIGRNQGSKDLEAIGMNQEGGRRRR